MANKGNKNTFIDLAKREGKITPVDLLQEIQPLLNEYFIGTFKIENGVLNMQFENGQNFKLSIN